MACAVMRRTRSHVSIRARTRGHSGIRAESRCAACVLRCFGAQGAARWPGALALRRMTERFGGGRGIRTPGTVSGSVVFKTTAIDHSAIPPRRNPVPDCQRLAAPRTQPTLYRRLSPIHAGRRWNADSSRGFLGLCCQARHALRPPHRGMRGTVRQFLHV
jgi:hypothetical protein